MAEAEAATTAARNRFLRLKYMLTPCRLHNKRDGKGVREGQCEDAADKQHLQSAAAGGNKPTCCPESTWIQKVLPTMQLLLAEQNAPLIQTTGTLQISQTSRPPK